MFLGKFLKFRNLSFLSVVCPFWCDLWGALRLLGAFTTVNLFSFIISFFINKGSEVHWHINSSDILQKILSSLLKSTNNIDKLLWGCLYYKVTEFVKCYCMLKFKPAVCIYERFWVTVMYVTVCLSHPLLMHSL